MSEQKTTDNTTAAVPQTLEAATPKIDEQVAAKIEEIKSVEAEVKNVSVAKVAEGEVKLGKDKQPTFIKVYNQSTKPLKVVETGIWIPPGGFAYYEKGDVPMSVQAYISSALMFAEETLTLAAEGSSYQPKNAKPIENQAKTAIFNPDNVPDPLDVTKLPKGIAVAAPDMNSLTARYKGDKGVPKTILAAASATVHITPTNGSVPVMPEELMAPPGINKSAMEMDASTILAHKNKRWAEEKKTSEVIAENYGKVKDALKSIEAPTPKLQHKAKPTGRAEWDALSFTKKKLAILQSSDVTWLSDIATVETDINILTCIDQRLTELVEKKA